MDRILNRLFELWQWDIEVLSEPWMYIPLLIPAACYAVFMLIKWITLLCPIWIVPYVVLKAINTPEEDQTKD